MDYMTNENSCCYMMVKKKYDHAGDIKKPEIYKEMENNGYEILGIGYTYKSEDGNFIIDNWDYKHEDSYQDSEMVYDFIQKGLAPALLQKDKAASRVLMGAAPSVRYDDNYGYMVQPENMNQGRLIGRNSGYIQCLIAQSEDLEKYLKDKKNQLINLINDPNFYRSMRFNFVNIDHVDKFIKYYNEIKKNADLFKGEDHYKSKVQMFMCSYDALVCHEKSLTNPLYPSLEAYGKMLSKTKKIISIEFRNMRDTERMLVNRNAQLGYEKKYFTYDELSDASLELQGIMSESDGSKLLPGIDSALKENNMVVLDPNNLHSTGMYFDNFKTAALISNEAIASYDAGYVKFSDIKNFDYFKIKYVLSKEAFECYKAGYFKFEDIKNFREDQIQELITEKAINLYKSGSKIVEVIAKLDIVNKKDPRMPEVPSKKGDIDENISEEERQKRNEANMKEMSENISKLLEIQEEKLKLELKRKFESSPGFKGCLNYTKQELLDVYRGYLSLSKDRRVKLLNSIKNNFVASMSLSRISGLEEIVDEKIKETNEHIDKLNAIIEKDLEKYQYKMGKKGKSIKLGVQLVAGFIAFMGLVVIIASISNAMNIGESQLSKLMGKIYKTAQYISKRPDILGFLGIVTGVGAIIGAEKYSKIYSYDQQNKLKVKFNEDIKAFMEKNKDEIKDTAIWR